MIKINLLPVHEKAKEENIRRQISLGVLLVGLLLVVLVFFQVQVQRELGNVQRDKAQLQEQLAALKKEIGDLSKIRNEKDAFERRKEAIGQLSQNRFGVVRVLDGLASAKPKALYFTSIEEKNPGAPWGDFSLTIQGIATDNEVIAQFMRNLLKVPIFKAVELDFTKAKAMQKEGGIYQEFRLDLQVVFEKKAPVPAEAPKGPSQPAGATKKG